jgi:hypothetical protein
MEQNVIITKKEKPQAQGQGSQSQGKSIEMRMHYEVRRENRLSTFTYEVFLALQFRIVIDIESRMRLIMMLYFVNH